MTNSRRTVVGLVAVLLLFTAGCGSQSAPTMAEHSKPIVRKPMRWCLRS